MNEMEELARKQIASGGCPVCQLPEQKLLEVDLYNGLSNDGAATRYGIGDNSKLGGELIRQHRFAGHMTPRDKLRRAKLALLREEAEERRAKRKAGKR